MQTQGVSPKFATPPSLLIYFRHGGLSAVMKLVKLFAESVNKNFLSSVYTTNIPRETGRFCNSFRRSITWREEGNWPVFAQTASSNQTSVVIWEGKFLYQPQHIYLAL